MSRITLSVERSLRVPAIAALVVGVVGVVGCAAREFDDPVAAMTDPELAVRENIAAMQQAAVAAPDDPRRIDTLKTILSAPGYSVDQRIEAFTLLRIHDENDARATLMYRLPSIGAWEFIEYACELVADEGWTEFTPALVRSLARPMMAMPIEDRPEKKALERLNPDKDVRRIVYDIVIAPTDSALAARWRLSAWELLGKLGDTEAWQASLLELDTTDPFLVNVKVGFSELGVIPRTREEIEWLQAMREPEFAEWWSRCRAAVSGLSEEQRHGLRLRHLAPMVIAGDRQPAWLAMSREELVSTLTADLRGRPYYPVKRGVEGPTDRDQPQRLSDFLPKLVWGDLLAIRVADDLVHESQVRVALLTQAEKDRQDNSTEYGGIIDVTAATNGPAAIMFSPRRRDHDFKFYAPSEMVRRGYTAPFHYHFHCQKPQNREFAGPGLGDLQYADAMAINGLVFTFIDRDRLDVDFYMSDNVVIDLGTIEP